MLFLRSFEKIRLAQAARGVVSSKDVLRFPGISGKQGFEIFLSPWLCSFLPGEEEKSKMGKPKKMRCENLCFSKASEFSETVTFS